MYEFQCASTDEGRDISEGEMGYAIEERGGRFAVVEYLASDPTNREVLEWMATREEAAARIREYLRIGAED